MRTRNPERTHIKAEDLKTLFDIAQESGLLEDQESKKPIIRLLRKISSSSRPKIEDIERLKRLIYPSYQAEQVRKLDQLYRTKKEIEEARRGQIALGHIISGGILTSSLFTKRIEQNEEPIWCFFGSPGAGKSVALLQVTLEWIKQGGKVIVIDREEKDYDKLIYLIKNILIISVKDDADPLITCDSLPDPFEWNNKFWDILGGSTHLAASTTVGMEVSEEILKEGRLPTIIEVLKRTRARKKDAFGIERNHLMSIENRLVSLMSRGGLGSTTNYKKGFSLKTLWNKYSVIVYQTGNLREGDEFIYTVCKISEWFKFSEYHELENPLLIVIDEAHFLFGKHRAPSQSAIVAPQLDILSRIRKRNIKLAIATPYPSQLSPQILNTSLLVCFRLHDIQDQKCVAGPLGLAHDQAILASLPKRVAIARGDQPNPFMIYTLDFPDAT